MYTSGDPPEEIRRIFHLEIPKNTEWGGSYFQAPQALLNRRNSLDPVVSDFARHTGKLGYSRASMQRECEGQNEVHPLSCARRRRLPYRDYGTRRCILLRPRGLIKICRTVFSGLEHRSVSP